MYIYAGLTRIPSDSLTRIPLRPEYMEANKAIRKKHLDDHEVGITVVAATLLKPEWKLEVEAVAAA